MNGLTTGRRRRLTRDLERLRLLRVEVEARIDFARTHGKVSNEEIARAANVVGAIARIEKELGIGIPEGATVADLGRVLHAWGEAQEADRRRFDGFRLAQFLQSKGWVKLS